MNDTNDNEFLRELRDGFLQEGSDLLTAVEDSFLKLEQDLTNKPEVDKLFRLFHNLKGSAAAVEFLELSHFCHAIEDLLSPIKKGEFPLIAEHIDLLLKASDRTKVAIEVLKQDHNGHFESADVVSLLKIAIEARGVESGKQSMKPARVVEPEVMAPSIVAETDPRLLQDFFSDANDQLESLEQNMVLLEKESNNEEAINSVFRAFHTLKSASAILQFSELEGLAHDVESLLDRIRNHELPGSPDIFNACFEALGIVRTMIDSLKKVGTLVNSVNKDTLATLRSKLKKLTAGEKPSEVAVAPAAVSTPTAQVIDMAQAAVAGGSSAGGNVVKEPVKVDADRLDRLVDTIGELVISEAMISQSSELRSFGRSTEISKQMGQLNKITRILQEIGMSLRMVPVKPVFRKMTRIVRDVSKKLGKNVNLELMGEETELDKTIVDKIGDPLVHMVRNAVDHGIERTPEDRTRVGKNSTGNVALRAFHKSGSIWIEVEDDGKGLDRDYLVKKAKEKGLIEQNAVLSDSEAFALIFLPGFSTAEKVTDVSGRGVGMDVVRRNIEEIRGTVEIKSELGKGTKFTIRIPNTLAIVEGMMVLIGKERYVIPTHSIVRSLKLEKEDVFTISGNKGEMIKVQGKIHPLVRLGEFYNVKDYERDPTKALALLVEDEGQQAALLIDKIMRKQQFVIKNLGDWVKEIPGVSGGTIMSDGEVGLILDITSMIKILTNKSSFVIPETLDREATL